MIAIVNHRHEISGRSAKDDLHILSHGCVDSQYPMSITIAGGSTKHLPRTESSTLFGLVLSGAADISLDGVHMPVHETQFFTWSGVRSANMYPANSKQPFADRALHVLLIERIGWRGQRMMGDTDRHWRYEHEDGYGATTLVPPARYGAPYLTQWSISKDQPTEAINTTFMRVGAVLGGSGILEIDGVSHEVYSDCVFLIPEYSRFKLTATSPYLRLVMFQPTGSWGPDINNSPL